MAFLSQRRNPARYQSQLAFAVSGSVSGSACGSSRSAPARHERLGAVPDTRHDPAPTHPLLVRIQLQHKTIATLPDMAGSCQESTRAATMTSRTQPAASGENRGFCRGEPFSISVVYPASGEERHL